MTLSFTLGVHQLWDEVQTMQTPGLYWLNVDREQDAKTFTNQMIAAQPIDCNAALISIGAPPAEIVGGPENFTNGPAKLPIFLLPQEEKALLQLSEDLTRILNPRESLLVLFSPASFWESIEKEVLTCWVTNINTWLTQHRCTLLVICHGSGVNNIRKIFISKHRQLWGLASLRGLQDEYRYDVAFWCNQNGVSASLDTVILHDGQGWRIEEEKPRTLQPRNDDFLYLAHANVLEGAPPLSENWSLFGSNKALADAAYAAQAATLIFSLKQNDQIDELAHLVHGLRRQRGNALKLIVRENAPCLRFSDERLLLACGANLIIPYNAPLSRSLTMIESVQGQVFPRHVPADINVLLKAMRPLNMKGYIPHPRFCETMLALMNNALLPEDSKGLLIALRPVPGLKVRQALTLCHIRRFGDLVTLDDERMTLFLSSCRLNDLDVALRHIFPLPVDEVFSNRMVWYQDKQIIAEIHQMQQSRPPHWQEPDVADIHSSNDPATGSGKRAPQVPYPITLLHARGRESAS